MEYITKDKKKSFKDVILNHLERTLEISSQEFRGGYEEEKIVGNHIEKIYIGNTFKKYIQVVESLSDILIGFFDKEMEKKYKEIMEKVNKIFENADKEIVVGSKEEQELIQKKHKLMRILFQELNKLLNRIDYLKGEIYKEQAEEILDID